MNIIALGNCCKKSKKNYENAVEAAKNCGINQPVQSIGEMKDILDFGVMSTPALVIDNQVVSQGKMLKVKEIENLINQRK